MLGDPGEDEQTDTDGNDKIMRKKILLCGSSLSSRGLLSESKIKYLSNCKVIWLRNDVILWLKGPKGYLGPPKPTGNP